MRKTLVSVMAVICAMFKRKAWPKPLALSPNSITSTLVMLGLTATVKSVYANSAVRVSVPVPPVTVAVRAPKVKASSPLVPLTVPLK
jgi:hypothetical protein